ncbi:putative membrane protein [Corynebacterium aurimucosum ATCC 700975]|uniref:Putative membrane protein n=1 Tax=Corynebacterium aurimucosum (strain ATCC 700975 / DSM 44827 / CIP 107346 / CN-1) TaxID=548476 RepID=C3PG73_CORA7|nr:putative membrane protein [Corynebacterium aurimucosum ATCC 700975]QQU93014.1 hypothetical protein I6I67_12600 [Corynebacterium aurimucosum]
MIEATLWLMDHTPLQLPRTQCGISLNATPQLAPKEQRAHDAQPNPRIDNSGLREVIEEAGPLPGRLKPGDVATWVFTTIVVLFACSMVFAFIDDFLGPARHVISRFQLISFIPIFPLLIFLILLLIGVRRVATKVTRARRLRTAWRNGWVEYRPALIGELVYLRSKTEGPEDRERTYFYYSAPLLLLQPDGTLAKAMSGEFRAANPNWLRSRGAALAEGSRIATVDTASSNGWTVAAYRTDGTSLEAELSNGLTGRQVDAVLQFAEQRWVR